MRFSLTLMTMFLMVVPSCWRCWFGGVLGEDTFTFKNKIEDGNSYDGIKTSSSVFSLSHPSVTSSASAASSASRADNSYFLVGFALLYPLLMIIVGVMLPK